MWSVVLLLAFFGSTSGQTDGQSCERSSHSQRRAESAEHSTGNSLLQVSSLKRKAPEDGFDFEEEDVKVEKVMYFNTTQKLGHQVGNLSKDVNKVEASVDKSHTDTLAAVSKISTKVDTLSDASGVALKAEVDKLRTDVKTLSTLLNKTTDAPSDAPSGSRRRRRRSARRRRTAPSSA
mmetsp:Transcript_39344/g.69218  ORF Transcript_39344/g.69218 Transcript_39344/m.69218 type:complete len:178 (-) Transcript_39344:59-592(-)